MRYSCTEDIMYGCGYNNTKKITTEEYRSVLFFGIRSLLTTSNVLVSAAPITSYNGAPGELDWFKYQEAGLEVKAVVCDRNNANVHTLIKFENGRYQRKRADGTVYTIHHLFDYIHLAYGFFDQMIRSNLFDTSVVTKAHAEKICTSNHLKRRGACLKNTSASSLKECMQLFTPATVANLDVAVQSRVLHTEEDMRTPEAFAGLTKLCKVMRKGKISSAQGEGQKAMLTEDLEPAFSRRKVFIVFLEATSIYLTIMKFHMVERNIDKRTQATIVKQLAFFKKRNSYSNGRYHRTNLLGFIIHLLLTGKNWAQETVENASSF
uniref:Uncharacterized protein n=1 Tax=Glossina palpalis gambiensis TaxID=67801 RepID=A0A1B0B0U9_9MUSC